MTKRQRQFAGAPTADLAFHIQTLHQTLAKMAGNGYADTHPAVADMRAELGELSAELERREDGGKVLPDARRPYMTDGEYIAAGLEPPGREQLSSPQPTGKEIRR